MKTMINEIQAKLGFAPIKWDDDSLVVLDQKSLPGEEKYKRLTTVAEVVESIGNLTVRGAPLIGIAAAYGLCLLNDLSDDAQFNDACRMLIDSRPTAVNLRWAVERMASHRAQNRKCDKLADLLHGEAARIHSEDADMCARIGQHGNSIVPSKCRILTHCNAGALATGGIGTALGVIYTAHFSGKQIEVWVSETRPILQGARLTAWELGRAGVPHTLITDSMAGHLMARGEVDMVITGADRIAANLDFANKIGTYSLAVLAKHHGVPFYAAAPSTTFDPSCPDGNSIFIERRNADEVRRMGDHVLAPHDSPVYNPAFDITPHELIAGIISESGLSKPWRCNER